MGFVLGGFIFLDRLKLNSLSNLVNAWFKFPSQLLTHKRSSPELTFVLSAHDDPLPAQSCRVQLSEDWYFVPQVLDFLPVVLQQKRDSKWTAHCQNILLRQWDADVPLLCADVQHSGGRFPE